jgi:hypothetical protein
VTSVTGYKPHLFDTSEPLQYRKNVGTTGAPGCTYPGDSSCDITVSPEMAVVPVCRFPLKQKQKLQQAFVLFFDEEKNFFFLAIFLVEKIKTGGKRRCRKKQKKPKFCF